MRKLFLSLGLVVSCGRTEIDGLPICDNPSNSPGLVYFVCPTPEDSPVDVVYARGCVWSSDPNTPVSNCQYVFTNALAGLSKTVVCFDQCP